MFQRELRIGVGIDTGRYGHRASFVRPDLDPAAKPLNFSESPEGYGELREVCDRLRVKYDSCQLHVHIDAAGQYAANLEAFVRSLIDVTVSVGEPKRNKDYHAVVSPKIKTDDTESAAMARYAVAEMPRSTPELSNEFLALRELTRRLKVKVGDGTRAVNRLHNLLARVFPELAKYVPNIAAAWVLALLDKYPTPAKIARAHPVTMAKIKSASRQKMDAIHALAGKSIGSFKGAHAEAVVRLAVDEVRQAMSHRKSLETLTEQAFGELPPAGHLQLTTILGIGAATAAVLTSKIVSIDRFDSAEKLVGFFGIFPKLKASGVDKQGNPNPNQSGRMCKQGNDLVRSYLYSAATAAVRCNPAVRALYRRLRSRGTRADVAMGHCMRKLLHLVHAVWSSNKPFNPEHYPWETPAEEPTPGQQIVEPATTTAHEDGTEDAAGRNQAQEVDSPAVTAANDVVGNEAMVVNEVPSTQHYLDFAHVRSQVSVEEMLEYLGLRDSLRPSNGELRGPCPIHSKETDKRRRHFAVNPSKNVFRCFSCDAQGNHLDLWAKLHDQTIYEAAQDVVQKFNLAPSPTKKRSP